MIRQLIERAKEILLAEETQRDQPEATDSGWAWTYALTDLLDLEHSAKPELVISDLSLMLLVREVFLDSERLMEMRYLSAEGDNLREFIGSLLNSSHHPFTMIIENETEDYDSLIAARKAKVEADYASSR